MSVDSESLAALRAIEFAREVCPIDLIFEGDCMQVIKALSSNEFDQSRLGNLYILAKEKLGLVRNFQIVHIGREGNRVIIV